MTRKLIRTKAFIRASKRFLKQNPNFENTVRETLILLSEDAYHPHLKTHKLKGVLSGSWACSVGFDLRIVFSFVDYDGSEAVLLESMGSHDAVY